MLKGINMGVEIIRLVMGRPGVIALPVLLFLGAVTGYLTYDWMVVKATPVEGVYENSPYRKDISGAQNQDNSQAENITEDQQPVEETQTTDDTPAKEQAAENSPANDNSPAADEPESSVITIAILKGSSVQNAPDYDPDHAMVPLAATIRWVNEDSTFHSATYGTGMDDPEFGSKFDTKMLAPGKDYSIAASEIGQGEYSYFCIAHPFMRGSLTIQ